MRKFQVAIDGPAGSGKSTISELVAKTLNFCHLDTGAMYRAITYKAMKLKIKLADDNAYDFIDDLKLEYKENRMYLDGKDISLEIRSTDVTTNVSTVAKNPRVREKLKNLQQEIAKTGRIILDGRDIGYNVLPDADLKIYLTASILCRAKRRLSDNQNRGIKSNLQELIREIEERDFQDASRIYSPLKKADDAIVIDTTDMTLDEVCNKIIYLINERIN